MWCEITYLFLNVANVEVLEWLNTHYGACDYLSIVGLKLIHCQKRDTGIVRNWEIHAWRDMQIVSTVCRKHIVNVFEIDCISAMTAKGCLADMQKWHGLWDDGTSDSGSCNFLTRMYPMWRCLALINGARNCYCVLIRTMWCHSQYFAFCWSILFYSSIVTRHWNLVDHKWRCTVKYVPCSSTSVTFFYQSSNFRWHFDNVTSITSNISLYKIHPINP